VVKVGRLPTGAGGTTVGCMGVGTLVSALGFSVVGIAGSLVALGRIVGVEVILLVGGISAEAVCLGLNVYR
jgi:hypothetical protein